MKPYWFGAIALTVVLLFTVLGYADKTRLHWVADDPTATPLVAPDRVVGVELRCTHYSTDRTVELRGAAGCEEQEGGTSDIYKYPAPSASSLLNRRQELTVRTSMGTSYTVAVSLITKFAIGDEWPPK
jgi:hypothetical protein